VSVDNSLVEAAEALRVAGIAGQSGGSIIYYDDVEIASLCTGAGELRARRFIESELGGLAADTDVARQTRQTLLAYSANSNFRATAVNLRVHHNTVRYRLEVAERILGHPIESRRLTTELALHLLCTIGARQ
jgi:DNA-binding PucR family transcriptional regulator